MSFTRIAVLNRGEAAMRLIHAVREINATGAAPIQVVALHTEGESRAMFVREADLSYDLGPASARPYLDLAVIERALVETGADAVWPGWGFLAEDPSFVDLCDRLGVTFIGPSAEAMRRLGDKIGSKLIAEEVGVPVAPWSRGAVDSLDGALTAAADIGYPLMLKATAGGGGRGIRMVASPADLEDAYQRTSDEALRAFGNGTVFLERLVTGARHVEVQMIADSHGTAWAIGVRDCSIQRRNQKVIEESASPLLTPEQTEELKVSAERLALAVGYVGAGTVEFLYHPGERTFAFLEVNTRLQVEHSITEVTTDLDLVKAQIHVAQGGRLEGEKPVEVGHAVEARLNAEDPDRDFAPSPGRIVCLDLPSGPGIRVDTGVAEGDTIPPDFDSMIAKIIAYGRTRDEALARLRRAMKSTTVVIEGGACNKSFVLDLLAQPEVVAGTPVWADTSWIDRVRAEGRLVAHDHAGIAVVAAAIEAYVDGLRLETVRLLETAHGGRPSASHPVGRPVELKLRGTPYQVSTVNTGPGCYRVQVVSGVVRGDGRGRDGPARRRAPAPGRRRPALPPGHGRARPHDAGRGRRRGAPRQPRRGRRPALAGPCAGGRHPGARRHRGRGRRRGGGAGVDEDGDRGRRAVRGPGQGAAGDHRQPGRDRQRAGQARAARRGRRGGRGRRRPGARAAGGRPLRRPRRRGGSGPGRPDRRRPGLRRPAGRAGRRALALPRPARPAARRRAGRRRRRADAAGHLRRPRRAEPQPPGRRGPAHRAARAQLARALPHLPAEPGRRPGRPARPVPRPVAAGPRSTTACPTSSARPRWRRRSSGSSWPSSAPRPRSRWPPRCSAAGSTSRPRPASSRCAPASCSSGSAAPPSCATR